MLVIHNLPCYSLPLTMDWPPTFIWKDNVIEECLICTTSNDLLLDKQSFLNRFPLTQIGSIVNGLMWKYLIFNLWKYEIRKCSLRNVFCPRRKHAFLIKYLHLSNFSQNVSKDILKNQMQFLIPLGLVTFCTHLN